MIIFLYYFNSLKRLDSYRRLNNLKIFDHDYSDLISMSSDFTFIKKLWSGKEIENYIDSEFKKRLLRSRFFLRLGMFYSIAMYIIFMLIKFINLNS